MCILLAIIRISMKENTRCMHIHAYTLLLYIINKGKCHVCVCVCLSDSLKSGSLPGANGGQQHIHTGRGQHLPLKWQGVVLEYPDNHAVDTWIIGGKMTMT